MNRNFYIPLLIGAMLLSAWCLLPWNSAPDSLDKQQSSVSLPDKKKDIDTKSDWERLADEIRPPTKNSDSKQNQPRNELAELQRDLLISGEKLYDYKLRILQLASIHRLCKMHSQEAIALVMEALLNPEQKYVIKTRISRGKIETSSYQFMEVLEYCVEGVPEQEPIYSDKDIPRFAEWWRNNKTNLRFKQLPPR